MSRPGAQLPSALEILEVCENGDFDTLFRWIAEGKTHCQHRVICNNTPLHYAAAHGNMEAVRELVERHKCFPDCRNGDSQTPLDRAVHHGHVNIVKYLRAKGCRPYNGMCDSIKHVEMVKYLMDGGCGYSATTICQLFLTKGNVSDLQYLEDRGISLKCAQQWLLDHRYSYYKTVNLLKDIKMIEFFVRKAKLMITVKFIVSCIGKKNKIVSDDILVFLVKNCCEDLYSTFIHNFYSDKPLLLDYACQINHLVLMKAISELNLNYQDIKGRTPLHVACEYRSLDLISYLIKKNCDPNLFDLKHQLPLHIACNYDDFEPIRLVSCCDYNAQDSDGNTPLHIVCASKIYSEEAIKYLACELKCSLSIFNNRGQLPLHMLLKNVKNRSVVSLILTILEECQSFDVNVQDGDGNSLLHVACSTEASDIIEYLVLIKQSTLNSLPLLSIANKHGKLPLHMLLKSVYWDKEKSAVSLILTILKEYESFDVNVQDGDGNSLLHIACSSKASDIIKYLISIKHAKQDTLNSFGQLPLHVALDTRLPLEIIELVSSDLTPAHINLQDCNGCTPLHSACTAMYSGEVIKYLACIMKCSFSISNNRGQLPLHLLLKNVSGDDKKSVVSLIPTILEACESFDVNVQDGKGNSLVHVVSSDYDYLDLMRFLVIEKRGNVNRLDNKGNLPLHIVLSSLNDSIEVIKLAGTGVSNELLLHKNEDGFTALHLACSKGHRECVHYLVYDKGCKPSEHPGVFSDLDIQFFCSDKNDFDLLSVLATTGNVNGIDNSGTPLQSACSNNNAKAVRLFTQTLNCNRSIKFSEKLPLHIACTKSLEMVELIIRKKDVDQPTHSDKATPLHIACEHNKVDIIQLLVSKYNCDQNLMNRKKELPLHLACAHSVEAVKILHTDNNNLNLTTYEGYTPLHIACKHKKTDIVQYKVKECLKDLTSLTFDNRLHPLQLACETGDVLMVKCLVENGGKTFERSLSGSTPLHIACTVGSVDVAKYLIDHGYDTLALNLSKELPLHIACTKSLDLVRITSFKCTAKQFEAKTGMDVAPLHIAASHGLLEVVKYLIEVKNCSPFTCDYYGNNAMAYACGLKLQRPQQGKATSSKLQRPQRGKATSSKLQRLQRAKATSSSIPLAGASSPSVAKYLIDCGCRPNEDSNLLSSSSEGSISCIEVSILQGNFDMFKVLVEKEHYINCQTKHGNTPLMLLFIYSSEISRDFFLQSIKFLLNRECNQNIQNVNGALPLHAACECNDLEIIKLLDSSLANIKNNDGDTALHITCRISDSLNHFPVFDKSYYEVVNNKGQSLLHIAVMKNKEKIIDFLLGIGICPSIRDNEGLPPIHYALSSSVLQLLLSHNSEIRDLTDSKGNTFLHQLCSNEKNFFIELITCLLSFGASVEIQNCDGNTPLHLACSTNFTSAVREISDHVKNFTIKNKDGNTPLHIACKKESVQLARDLKSFSSCCQNNKGNTPLHIACLKGNLHLVKALCDGTEGFDLYVQNVSGDTPLHSFYLPIINYFMNTQKKSLVKALKIKNNNGYTPFHNAVDYLQGEELHSILLTLFAIDQELLHIACKANSRYAFGLVKRFVKYLEAVNKDLKLPLHVAASESSGQCSSSAISVVQLVNQQDRDGNTALHVACEYRNYAIAKYLLDTGWAPDLRNKVGQSPLHCACRTFKASNIIAHAYSGSDVINMQDNDGNTPLHIACISNSFEWVKELVKNRLCNFSIQNKRGETALHIACTKADLSLINPLLSSRAQRAAALKSNLHGELPVHLILYKNSPHNSIQCVEAFTYSHKNFNIQTSNGDTLLHLACKNENIKLNNILNDLIRVTKCDSSLPNCEGDLPLHLACRRKDLSLQVLELFANPSNINMQNQNGCTALHELCHHQYRDSIQLDSKLSYVIQLGCAFNLPDATGDLPLHLACRKKYLSLNVLKLFATQSNINMQNKNKRTALHELCHHQELQIQNEDNTIELDPRLSFMIKLGCAFNLSDITGAYPLHLACRYQSLAIVKCFEPHGITGKLENGNTVLHEACLNKSKASQIVRYLLDYRPELNYSVQNSEKNLALHLACRNRSLVRYGTVEIMINCTGKNSIHTTNNNGDTVLHELFKSEVEETIVDVLENYEFDISISNGQQETLLHLACRYNLLYAVKHILNKCLPISDYVDSPNSLGQTPVTLTSSNVIIQLLLENGCSADPLYQMHHDFISKFSYESPPETPACLLVIGNPCAGKTTLVSSLKEENDDVTTETFARTAGIVSSDFHSDIYGQVTIYDFAGQPEYYASHDTVIHNTIKRSPPIVLLVVDLTHPEDQAIKSISFWSSFIENRFVSLTDKAHLFIVCSHADLVKENGGNPGQKAQKIFEAIQSKLSEIPSITFQSLLTMDCTKSKSAEMKELQSKLSQSSTKLRQKGVLNFEATCLLTFIKQTFKEDIVIPLDKLIYKASKSEKKIVPENPKILKTLCQDLNDSGCVMFLENCQVLHLSWLILKKEALLAEVSGRLFAPSNFPEYVDICSSHTGVVRFSSLREIFPHYDPNMLFGFLCQMEYCQQITNEKVVRQMLQLKDIFKDNETYYFFPSAVKVERPSDEWNPDLDDGYQFGWIMECENCHFSPSFIQILLLRLIFGSTKIESLPNTPFDIHSMSIVWKSGIKWSNDQGIDIIVDVIEQSKVLVLMYCFNEDRLEMLKYRSSLLKLIRSIKKEVCPVANTAEFFIYPKHIQHPLPLDRYRRYLVNSEDLLRNESKYIYSRSGSKMKRDAILYFDPYTSLCKVLAATLKNQELSKKSPNQNFLEAVAIHLQDHYELFVKIVSPVSLHLHKINQLTSVREKIVTLLTLWLKRIGSTFKSLRDQFNHRTVFNSEVKIAEATQCKKCNFSDTAVNSHEIHSCIQADFQMYVSSLPQESLQYLDNELDWDHKGVDRDLNEIADNMIRWEENLSTLLELTEVEIYDIKAMYPNSAPKLQRREVLKTWKKNQGLQATYGHLLDLFARAEHNKCAQTVCDILKRQLEH